MGFSRDHDRPRLIFVQVSTANATPRWSDAKFVGPAIVEQLDATTVIEPQDTARIDRCGNIVIEIGDIGR